MRVQTPNGWGYLRTGRGDDRVNYPLGKIGNSPTIYKPQLFQDKAENILSKIPDDSIDCIITDPPYGIEFDQNRYHAAELGDVAHDTSLEFLDLVAPEFDRVLKDTGHLFVFTRWDAYRDMAPPIERHVADLDSLIVWDKDDGGHGMGDLTNWAPRHELIMYARGSGAELSDRKPNVIRHQDVRFTSENKMHPTQKPRGLMEELIKPTTDVGDVVLDPFGGSYAVPRAAMRLFRKSVACELDPETHMAGEGMVKKDLQKDPEYGNDWRETTNVDVNQTEVVNRG